MKNIDFTIDEEDLKVLMVHVIDAYKGYTFERFKAECEKSYSDYYERNTNDLARYGTPKTYSQWVNGQILSLTGF